MVMIIAATPVGNRIRSLRDDRGWSQKQLAYEARVPRPWLSLVETGDIERPSADRVEQLARALGVTSRYILSGAREAEVDLEDIRFQAREPRIKRWLNRLADSMLEDVPIKDDSPDE
jgi:transcriptional regulator with XRE-family HTH domain